MRTTRLAAMAAAAVFVVGCSDDKSVTDLRQGRAEMVSLAPGSGGSGASFTTINEPGDCGNGPGTVNCNQYVSKEAVYLNGGPASSALGDGNYYWAILTPSAQNAGNVEGASGNLSDDQSGGTLGDGGHGDPFTNRSFTVTNGAFQYTGVTHAIGNAKPSLVQLAVFDDTDNGGGVYILAICRLDGAEPAATDKCKFDAFKVNGDGSGTGNDIPLPPVVTKNAGGSYDRTWSWGIAKAVDKTLVSLTGGSATFNYTVTVTNKGSVDGNYVVSGDIEVINPNLDVITGATVSDVMAGGTCTLKDEADATPTAGGTTLPSGSTTFGYTCSFAAAPDVATATNTVTVEWPEQVWGADPDIRTLAAGTATFSIGVPFTMTEIDESVSVTDSYKGDLGTVLASASSPTTFTYSRTVPVPSDRCVVYGNTATFTAVDSKVTGSDSRDVTVCIAATSGLTIGFWQNKNGQAVISGSAATAGVCNATTFLRAYLPLQDLSATATCAKVATYATSTMNGANASGASMNAMLKAQFLATALSVYYSSPAGGSRIPGPSLGPIYMDLTKVCKLTSTGICSGTFVNVTAAFLTPPPTYMTIADMLAAAATKSNVGGSSWYANIKSTQELAKNAFDAINNKSVVVAVVP